MNNIVSWRRALRAIERDLTDADPRLARLFSMFTALAEGEGLPSAERLKHRGIGVLLALAADADRPLTCWRSMVWPVLLVVTALTVACTLVVVGAQGNGRACPVRAERHISQPSPATCVGQWRWSVGK